MIVYKTVNLINGKIYIGKDEANNPKYLGSGTVLKKAIKKYGISNFKKEILEECNCREDLSTCEIKWINKLNSTNPVIGYNIAEGGTGGNTYYGKSKSELIDIKTKISKSLANRKFTEEHKNKLSKSASLRKGNKPNVFNGMKMEEYLEEDYAKDIKNKISSSLKEHYKDGMSKEQRQKISKAMKGRKLGPMSEEHKKNLKESFKNRDIVKRKKLIKSYIEKLDTYLEDGITNENNDKAKRVYKSAENKKVDLSKYSSMLKDFKAISHERRANANRNRNKK